MSQKNAFTSYCFPLFWYITTFNLDEKTSALYSDLPGHLQKRKTTAWPHTKAEKAPAEQHQYLFVVGDELGLHVARHEIHSPQHLPGLQPPDGTRCVDARGTCKPPVWVSGWRGWGPTPASLAPVRLWAQQTCCKHFLSAGRVPGEPKRHVLNPRPRALASVWRDETRTCEKLDSMGGINNHSPYLASFPLSPTLGGCTYLKTQCDSWEHISLLLHTGIPPPWLLT